MDSMLGLFLTTLPQIYCMSVFMAWFARFATTVNRHDIFDPYPSIYSQFLNSVRASKPALIAIFLIWFPMGIVFIFLMAFGIHKSILGMSDISFMALFMSVSILFPGRYIHKNLLSQVYDKQKWNRRIIMIAAVISVIAFSTILSAILSQPECRTNPLVKFNDACSLSFSSTYNSETFE
jgi:hypothetical protein